MWLVRTGSMRWNIQMTTDYKPSQKRSARKRVDEIRDFRCKNLIVVIEDPETQATSGPFLET